MPELCRFCRVFCASCLRLIGLLGMKTEWTSSFKVFDLSESAVYVLSLDFSAAIQLEYCLECLRTEHNVLGLTLGGTSMSFSSLFKQRMSFK